MSTPPERRRAARAPRAARLAAASLLALALAALPPTAFAQSAAPRPDPAIRDTIVAVFRRPEYARSVQDTLWTRFARWFGGLLRRLFADTGDHPAGRQVAIAVLIALGVLVVARVVYGAIESAELRRGGRSGRALRASAAGDPWREAREHAAAGRYVDAAHALYQALLAGLADHERLRLHPSKTAGDYVRDLRARRSPALPRFRDFARAYEVVAYGTGECDRARYERLLSLASATLGADDAAPRRAGAA